MPVAKYEHEFRDPIHTFIRVTSDERKVIDSRPFQRLRHIHQLALTLLVYPGATHRRFEHCLGVMELAGRAFDVIARQAARLDEVRHIFPPDDQLSYWKTVLRMGALCHDLGHIPFSHGAESLLPAGVHHEQLSVDLILSDEMTAIWSSMHPPLNPIEVAKVAVGLKDWPGDPKAFTPWEELLTDIVTGPAFGVDRADYLLRDSHHAGVAYGHFDHYRLIDTLRVLPKPGTDKPTIGIEKGGLHAAEGLQLARYFMFEQLYHHRVRRALDLHLREFLKTMLPGGQYPTDLEQHLRLTDNEVLTSMAQAVEDDANPGYRAANRILNRGFHRVLYQPTEDDLNRNLNVADAVYERARTEFGDDFVARDRIVKDSASMDFAVLREDGRITSSLQESQVLTRIPAAKFDYVFVAQEKLAEARKWLADNLEGILAQGEKEEP